MFKIKTNYLEHDGGTKFYETVMIGSDTDNQILLIKRYGSMKQKHGAGQVKIERYTDVKSAINAHIEILREKRAHRSGKGQYIDSAFPLHGLHTKANQAISAEALKDSLYRHYTDKDNSLAIINYFGIGSAMEAHFGEDEVVDTTVDETPIDRGANWGAW